MSHGTYTFWNMTINNYTETDVALIQQGYPDDIRQLVYTFEEGEQGTPHIQAYIKMKRQVRLAQMSKLFPRGRFRFLDTAEYRLNAQRYAQKLDDTARSPAIIQNGDPLHTIEGTVRRVINRLMDEYPDVEDLTLARRHAERAMVVEDYTMAKVFVSSTYRNMWRDFGNAMYQSLFMKRQAEIEKEEAENRGVKNSSHTHTHTQPELFSHQEEHKEDASTSSGRDVEDEGTEGEEDHQAEGGEDEADEADSEGGEGYCEADSVSGSGDEIRI